MNSEKPMPVNSPFCTSRISIATIVTSHVPKSDFLPFQKTRASEGSSRLRVDEVTIAASTHVGK
jgi:hypothetical protein